MAIRKCRGVESTIWNQRLVDVIGQPPLHVSLRTHPSNTCSTHPQYVSMWFDEDYLPMFQLFSIFQLFISPCLSHLSPPDRWGSSDLISACAPPSSSSPLLLANLAVSPPACNRQLDTNTMPDKISDRMPHRLVRIKCQNTQWHMRRIWMIWMPEIS